MRIGWVVLAGAAAAVMSWAGDRQVTVCLPSHHRVDSKLQSMAQGYASRVYRSLGVELRWRGSCREADIEAPATSFAPNLTVIGIAWAEQTPTSASPGARAAAQPFQPTGTRITLYLDRLTPLLQEPDRAAAVLGHVLAHEIGHVLLGHNGHAREGLMKATWSNAEQGGMRCHLLSFTEEQADTIRQNLDRRATALAAAR